MGDIIVIGGKGGTGKTSLAALLTLYLSKKKSSGVLAIDADPNSNLAESLGSSNAGSISDIIDEVAKKPEMVPQNMGKDAFIEYRVHQEITESEGYDLLVMGRPEGPGCYCYINNVLRNCMAKLTRDYGTVIIDNEAGLEHFSRKTTRECTHLLVVSDPTETGRRSAIRILELVDELGINAHKRYLFINRSDKNKKGDSGFEKAMKIDSVFSLPFDHQVLDLSVKGRPLSELSTDSPMKKAVAEAGEEIWPRN